MPEGPEVEQVLISLKPKVVNRTIKSIEISPFKITIPLKGVGRQEKDVFVERVEGATVNHIERKGKYLIFYCEKTTSKPIYMIAHLGMTGAFFVVTSIDEIPLKYRKHIHIELKLDNGSSVVYSDQRRFGWLGALNHEEFIMYGPLKKIGPDPFDEDAPEIFIRKLREKKSEKQPIKKLLLQPENISGVGNIYACECLFRAQIHPETVVGMLSDKKLLELVQHLRDIFKHAMESGGSSIRDYVNSEGETGFYQIYHNVYNKKQCPKCSSDIENIKIDKRSSFYCPECQKKVKNRK